MSGERFEMAKGWEPNLTEAVKPGLEKTWWDFCARMKGKNHDEIRAALDRDWRMTHSDQLVEMLARGDRVEPRFPR